jgi:hypothetical protein
VCIDRPDDNNDRSYHDGVTPSPEKSVLKTRDGWPRRRTKRQTFLMKNAEPWRIANYERLWKNRHAVARLLLLEFRINTIQRDAVMKLPKNLGTLLLAVWLILYGVLTAPFLHLSFAYSGDVLAVFAVVVGVLLLLQRSQAA